MTTRSIGFAPPLFALLSALTMMPPQASAEDAYIRVGGASEIS